MWDDDPELKLFLSRKLNQLACSLVFEHMKVEGAVYAAKKFRVEMCMNPEKKFFTEFCMLFSLCHPNIIQ